MGKSYELVGEVGLICTMEGIPTKEYVDKIFELFDSDAVIVKNEEGIALDFSLNGIEDIPTYLRHIVHKLDESQKDIGITFKYAKVE